MSYQLGLEKFPRSFAQSALRTAIPAGAGRAAKNFFPVLHARRVAVSNSLGHARAAPMRFVGVHISRVFFAIEVFRCAAPWRGARRWNGIPRRRSSERPEFFSANLLTSQKHMISFRSATAPLRKRVIKVKPTTSNTSQQSTGVPATVDNGKLPSAKRLLSLLPITMIPSRALAGSAGAYLSATAHRATHSHPSAAPLAPRRFATAPVAAALPL